MSCADLEIINMVPELLIDHQINLDDLQKEQNK